MTIDRDDGAKAGLTVRCNGKLFCIHTTLSGSQSSSETTSQYFASLKVIRSGEEQIDVLFESNFDEWDTALFQALFEKLPPTPTWEDITKIALHGYLFPDFHVRALDAIND